MPAADLADIVASLPSLTFAPATEAPVSPGWCLVAPADAEWCIAHRDEAGWFSADGTRIDGAARPAAGAGPPKESGDPADEMA